MAERWERGDWMIDEVDKWLAGRWAKYQPIQPVTDPAWADLEEAVNQAYYQRDEEGLRAALRRYAEHGLALIKAGSMREVTK